jgi:hypothetical protein
MRSSAILVHCQNFRTFDPARNNSALGQTGLG